MYFIKLDDHLSQRSEIHRNGPFFFFYSLLFCGPTVYVSAWWVCISSFLKTNLAVSSNEPAYYVKPAHFVGLELPIDFALQITTYCILSMMVYRKFFNATHNRRCCLVF